MLFLGVQFEPDFVQLVLSGLVQETFVKMPTLKTGNTSINHLLFADDLILVSTGKSKTMNSLIRVTSDYCTQWKLRIAAGETKILQYGGTKGSWILPRRPMPGFDIINEDPFAKYLGIDLEPRSASYCKKRVKKVLSIARDYATALRHVSTDTLDRVDVALALWKSCALSSILYASETVSFTKTDLKKLDAIQCGVARRICQVDGSTANVSSLIETGLIPISIMINARKVSFYLKISELDEERLVKQSLNENTCGNWTSRFMK